MLARTLFAALVLVPTVAQAAESYDNCVGFIDSLPTTISTQGTWCLRRDLATGIASGNAIQVSTNNVTIDCNDFKVGNLQAGMGTLANGIHTSGTLNVTVRNCNVRGFLRGISLLGGESGGNYVVENNRVQGATDTGIRVEGDGSMVRGNRISQTGGTTSVYSQSMGIQVAHAIDVLDNTIDGVSSLHGAYGISAAYLAGGSIRGNRVRGISAEGPPFAIAIDNWQSPGMVIGGNELFGTGGTGINCDSDTGTTTDRVRDNLVNGFEWGIVNCADAGGNDITP